VAVIPVALVLHQVHLPIPLLLKIAIWIPLIFYSIERHGLVVGRYGRIIGQRKSVKLRVPLEEYLMVSLLH
jgi:hypothetical protein